MMKPQRVAIIGVGAMGSIYAGLIAEAGNEVWAIDTWTDHVDAINAHGLRVEGASGDRFVKGIRAVTSLVDADPCDIYVIATKAADVCAAARGVSAVMPEHALVLTMQNGLGAGERIAQHMPADNVLLGVAEGFGASMQAPGHVHHNAMKLIRLGEMVGGISDRLRQLEALWQGAGFNACAFEDIHLLIWEKFLCNVTLSAPCTVFDCTVGELMAHPEWREVALGCMREAHACGLAEGIQFSFDDPKQYVTDFAAMMPTASPSMRLDHMASRASEIAAINGIVPVVAARHGLNAPFNQTLSAVVRASESAFAKGKS